MAAELASWVGVDRSATELGLARRHACIRVVQADAVRLPFAADGFSAAVLVMSAQVLMPLGEVLAELARVLRLGGTVVVLLPARRPLPLRDVVLYLRLQARLRRRIGYPNDRQLGGRRFGRLLRSTGFEVVEDIRRPFLLPLAYAGDADLFMSSLYLPGVAQRRVDRGVELLRRRVGGGVAVPLRRVVLRRSGRDA
jgi:SAM-dependent methyltransferase